MGKLYFISLIRKKILKMVRKSASELSGRRCEKENTMSCNGDHQQKLKNSYFFMPGNVHLSSSTLSQVLDETADRYGDHIAFISAHQGISKTYSEFKQEVRRLASGLVACGLRKGDRIAICCPNCYEWPLIQFATAKAGLILANINPASQPMELEYLFKKVDCKAVILWDILKTQNFYEMMCKIIPDLPTNSPNKFRNSSLPNLEIVIMISEHEKDGVLNFKDVLESGDKESDQMLIEIEKSVQFDDPVNIQFTSGTTGFPKGAVLSHHNIVNNAFVFGNRLGFDAQIPIICCQVPLFHCFGCVMGSLSSVLYHGICVFPFAGYSPTASLKSIEQYKCTTVYGSPTMFVDLLHHFKLQKFNIATLKQAVIGGAASSETLVKNIRDVMDVDFISNAYGSTENSPVVALNAVTDDFRNVTENLLQPLELVECKVVDDNGKLVPVHTQGELCARGHVLFIGYWNDSEKTAEVVDKTNWYHTGDLVVMNEYGYIKVVGRKKDMIIRGGENIYPLEIENFLNTHTAILEVHLVGVPDERMGEEICAWVSVHKGIRTTVDDIKNFCKGKISHFKIPRYILFVEDFPKTQSGKIKKYEMARISKEKLKL